MNSLQLYLGCAPSAALVQVSMLLATGEFSGTEVHALLGQRQPGYAMPLALSPDKKHLYVVSRGVPFFIACYDATGNSLRYLGRTEIAENLACLRVSVDGRYLLGASYDDHLVALYALDEAGLVSAEAEVKSTAANAHMLIMAPDQSCLLSTSLGGDCLYRWPQAPAAAGLHLQQADILSVAAGTGPRHLAFHKSQAIAYVVGELVGSVLSVDYRTTPMRLLDVQTFTRPRDRAHAADIHLSADGRMLFVSDRVHSELFSYRVADDGQLTFIESLPTLAYPRSFIVTDDSQWLVVAGEDSRSLASYRIDPVTGRLTLTSNCELGHAPDWIEC